MTCQNPLKREIDFSGADSDSDIEDGECSYHNYDDDTNRARH